MRVKLINSFVSFTFLFIVYIIVISTYYIQSKSLVIHALELEIQNILITHKAINDYVSSIQKPKIYELKEQGLLDKDFFSPVFLSSTYTNMELNTLANKERKAENKPKIIVKYASLNPTNTQNLVNPFERNLFEKFKTTKMKTYQEIVIIDGVEYLYYAQKGKTIEAKCLQCHGDPKDAPSMMLQKYGSINGFGFKLGELASFLSVKIPLDETLQTHKEEFYRIALFTFIIFILFFLLSQWVTTYITKHKDLQKEISVYSKLLAKSTADVRGIILEVNDAFCELTGYSRGELIGHSHSILRHPDTKDEVFTKLWETITKGNVYVAEIKNRKKDGRSFWMKQTISPQYDSENTIIAYENIVEDITEKKQLESDALTDPLTSLYNRRGLESIFEREYQRSGRQNHYFAYLMIDIDLFKQYNDTYGHDMGDIVLQKISKEIKSCFRRNNDYVFRIGGEEFGVVLVDKEKTHITNVAKLLCKSIKALHIEHKKSSICEYVTISVGISIVKYSKNLKYIDIYKEADSYLYSAKENGRDRVEYK